MPISSVLNVVTPIEKYGNLWFKRDDLFELDGMYGAKVRACLALCERAKEQGYTRVVSAGSRYSPQLAILGIVADYLGLKAIGVTATGESLPLIRKAEVLGVEIHKVPYGYTNVIQKRARDLSEALGAFLVPFGMRDDTSIYLTSQSLVCSFPDVAEGKAFFSHVNKIVVVAGSGVNLLGILVGLRLIKSPVKVLAVLVGHDCRKYVYSHCPWIDKMPLSFIKYDGSYHSLSTYNQVNGIDVDSRYEGKAIPFLEPGDLFWLIGKAITSPVVISREI